MELFMACSFTQLANSFKTIASCQLSLLSFILLVCRPHNIGLCPGILQYNVELSATIGFLQWYVVNSGVWRVGGGWDDCLVVNESVTNFLQHSQRKQYSGFFLCGIYPKHCFTGLPILYCNGYIFSFEAYYQVLQIIVVTKPIAKVANLL